MKTCSVCKQTKERGEFRVYRKREGGTLLSARCRKCDSVSMKSMEKRNWQRSVINCIKQDLTIEELKSWVERIQLTAEVNPWIDSSSGCEHKEEV